LDLKEIVGVFTALDLSSNKSEIEARVRKFDEDKSGFLDFNEFESLWEALFTFDQARPLFDKYARPDHLITVPQLALLIQRELRLSVNAQWVAKTISKGPVIAFYQFCTFLADPRKNSLIDATVINKADDMNHPLAHYFLASSHNSYLEEDQLAGKASGLAYQQCFELTCKCVELDLWDGPSGIPEITHGHTLCGKVSVLEVCDAINQHGFKGDAYPVILSLENHLSAPQQDKLAEIFREKFKSRLPPPFNRTAPAMPSPESLRGKVLLKGGICDEANPKSGQSANLSKLIHLGTYSCPKKPEFEPKPAFMMFSASEGDLEAFANEPAARRALQIHNSVHLTRSYPKGTRVGSSNYDPCPGWVTGTQVVALNYQTASEPMWLNDAKFKLNGGRGWILKPQWLIDGAPPPNQGRPIQLKVSVIRGGGYPSTARDIIDPYIEVKVVGWKEDTKKERTKTISNNGLDPFWGQDFTFSLVAPELDFLCFYLWDFDTASADDLVGHFVVPVQAILPGLHSVPFYDNSRERKWIRGSWLLVDVTLST
jgi:hypothetical protein